MEKVILNKHLADAGIRYIVRKRVFWLLFYIALFISMSSGAGKLRIDERISVNLLKQSKTITIGTDTQIGYSGLLLYDFLKTATNNEAHNAVKTAEALMVSLIIIITLLSALVRQTTAVLALLAVILSTVITSAGMMGWMEYEIDSSTIPILPLIASVSVMYSLFFLVQFRFHFKRRGNLQQALHFAFSQFTWPSILSLIVMTVVLLTCLFTASFINHSCWIGSALVIPICFFHTITLFPLILSLGKEMNTEEQTKPTPGVLPFGMSLLSKWVLKKRLILLIILLLTLVPAVTLSVMEAGSQIFLVLSVLIVLGLFTSLLLKSWLAGLSSFIGGGLPLFVLNAVANISAIDFSFAFPAISILTAGFSFLFFYHYKDELSVFQDFEKANLQTFIKVGHPFIFTTIILIPTFGSLVFSPVKEIAETGILLIISILVIVFNGVGVAPVLASYLKPFPIKRPPFNTSR